MLGACLMTDYVSGVGGPTKLSVLVCLERKDGRTL
jgi:hypothetical protein